jgi:hypothetical protein
MASFKIAQQLQGDFKICVGACPAVFCFRAGSLDVGDAPAYLVHPRAFLPFPSIFPLLAHFYSSYKQSLASLSSISFHFRQPRLAIESTGEFHPSHFTFVELLSESNSSVGYNSFYGDYNVQNNPTMSRNLPGIYDFF